MKLLSLLSIVVVLGGCATTQAVEREAERHYMLSITSIENGSSRIVDDLSLETCKLLRDKYNGTHSRQDGGAMCINKYTGSVVF